jgi:hypothetical protein
VKTSRTRVDVRPGPAIGRDNDHVFRTLLGIPEDRYRQLVEEQVIYQSGSANIHLLVDSSASIATHLITRVIGPFEISLPMQKK